MVTLVMVTQPVAIFLIVLIIILSAPLILNRLRIPHIIGMIVAGVAVGPYGFKILENDSSFAIFGQVGLLYLMFLAGLEIDMYHLKLNLKRGLLFGFLTLIVPLILGVASSHYLLHLDLLTSLLLGTMYASHTLIAYPVATRFGITRSPAVLISIVGTIIAVIGALLALAATVSVRREGALDLSAFLKLLGMLVGYSLLILYAYPRITRFFFKLVSDKVNQYVFILALVFLASWGAQAIHLEPVLGAFLAGLVLNRYVPAGSSLMSSIEFVGNALFIPYFLISVGMMINLGVVFNVSTLSVAGVMLAVALLSKWIPALIVQKVNKLSSASRGVIFGLTTAHTAVALAVVTLGMNLGMMDARVFNSTMVVILVSCALAPIFTSGSAAKLKVEMAESDDGSGDNHVRRIRRHNILVSLGNPIIAQQLVDLAALLRSEQGSYSIFGLHVRTDNSNSAKAVSRATIEEARKAAAAADMTISPIERFDLNVVTGLINTINERDITEVILGMHRRSTVVDSFFGTNTNQLLRATNKMIIITRTFIPANTLTRIVVWAPKNAQYETGFSQWVRSMASLTRQVGCRIIFCCPEDIQPLIRGILYHDNFGIRCEFRTIESWDDFILMSNRVLDDDLFVVIGSRVNSVSYSDAMLEMPQFLQKYFSRNNLLVIYPEQFGEADHEIMSFADPMAVDLGGTPSPIWLHIKSAWKSIIAAKKKISHRRRKKKF
ncbi:MAG: cation:proton antiporter [Clostridium sp.]|nr:cation:proton antiporter [Clostridium sp.]